MDKNMNVIRKLRIRIDGIKIVSSARPFRVVHPMTGREEILVNITFQDINNRYVLEQPVPMRHLGKFLNRKVLRRSRIGKRGILTPKMYRDEKLQSKT